MIKAFALNSFIKEGLTKTEIIWIFFLWFCMNVMNLTPYFQVAEIEVSRIFCIKTVCRLASGSEMLLIIFIDNKLY